MGQIQSHLENFQDQLQLQKRTVQNEAGETVIIDFCDSMLQQHLQESVRSPHQASALGTFSDKSTVGWDMLESVHRPSVCLTMSSDPHAESLLWAISQFFTTVVLPHEHTPQVHIAI